MPIKKRTPKPLPVPQTLAEAAQAQKKITELMLNIRELEGQFERQRLDIDRREDAVIAELTDEILALAKSVYAYASAHRTELTQDGKRKSVPMPGKAGAITWYMPPPSVHIERIDEVLERIKERGLKQFVRTKEEINKQALLSESALAKTIEGVAIRQSELFLIKPSRTRERLECNTKTKRWKFSRLA